MVVIVCIVIPEHPSVIDAANQRIDVGDAVLHNTAVLALPYLFLECRTTPGPLQQDCFRKDLSNRWRRLRHVSDIAQTGHAMPHLYRMGRRSPSVIRGKMSPQADELKEQEASNQLTNASLSLNDLMEYTEW